MLEHRKRVGRAKTPERYWRERVRSPAFKRALVASITRELERIGQERVRHIIDPDWVRTVIREWDNTMLNRQLVADLAVAATRRGASVLRKQRRSPRAMLGSQFVADLDALLDNDTRLSPAAEELIAEVMQEEFVRRLFKDLIFTSLVAFHERVNPFFAGITMRLLREQIRGFIDLFMPLVQEQAIAFAVHQENQRILFDFIGSIVRQLLDAPLAHYRGMLSAGQKRKAQVLLKNAIADAAENADLQKLVRELALALWDNTYRMIRDKRVGDLLCLDARADWLAERVVELLLPLISRPGAIQFMAAEFALAAALPQSEE